jgi:nitrite reductase (NADH) large subunit
MTKRLVCLCNFVEEKEIRALLKKGVLTTSDIQTLSKAGTSCGRCLPEIDSLVEKYKNKKPKDQQGKLEFGL